MAITTKIHGISFTDEMVRAIVREGNPKTMTRRAIKDGARDGAGVNVLSVIETHEVAHVNPYGNPGDVLYVKEAFAEFGRRHRSDGSNNRRLQTLYRATNVGEITKPWRPSRQMPKHAARLFLEIVSVKVERVQDISVEDCYAEGVDLEEEPYATQFAQAEGGSCAGLSVGCRYPEIVPFMILWDHINGKTHPWKSNPFVWAITFKRVKIAR